MHANGNGNGHPQQQQQSQGLIGGGGGEVHAPGSIFAGDGQLSEDSRRVLEWISQVLGAGTREAALLELSKKREQVPELALILWHSFGGFLLLSIILEGMGMGLANVLCRCHDLSASRDNIRLPAAQPLATDGRGV